MEKQQKILIGVAIFFALLMIFGSGILFFLPIAGFFLLQNFTKISKNFGGFEDFLNQQNNFRKKTGVKENFFKGEKKFSDITKNFNKNNNYIMNKIAIIPIILGILGFSIVADGIVNVPAGSVAVIFDRGKGVLEQPLGEGIHLKIPFWQKSTILTTRMQSYTMSSTSGEGSQYGDDAISALTKDGQKVGVDITIQFSLEKINAPNVYQNIGLNYVEKIIRPGIRSIAREVITGFDSKDLFQNETRQKTQMQISDKMKKYLSDKKINLEGVLVRNIEFSKIYLNAIEEKQVAQQKIQKAEYEKQQALIIKERKIIEAQAEAEAIKLKGQALKENKEIIQLQMIDKLSPSIKWGVLPDSVMPLLNLNDLK
ncbi:prohibitin family protein [Candidatus Gracilibacteria bacterium]|nr:prohibitin family protein [Candidatus Gracilibacteria bacterium]